MSVYPRKRRSINTCGRKEEREKGMEGQKRNKQEYNTVHLQETREEAGRKSINVLKDFTQDAVETF